MHALNMHSYAFFFNFLYISYFDRLSRFAKFGINHSSEKSDTSDQKLTALEIQLTPTDES